VHLPPRAWRGPLCCSADAFAGDKNRATPLYIAVRTGCLDVVRFLLREGAGGDPARARAAVDATTAKGWTPLFVAAYKNRDVRGLCILGFARVARLCVCMFFSVQGFRVKHVCEHSHLSTS
jgi:hypothetical protein